jgi:transposase
MKRRSFSASFKEEAVKLVKEHGRSAGKAAKELGISESALRRWIEATISSRATRPDIQPLRRPRFATSSASWQRSGWSAIS